MLTDKVGGNMKTWLKRWIPSGRTTAIGIPFVFLLLFFLIPFLLVISISFSQQQMGIPPYSPLTKFEDGVFSLMLSVSNYTFVLSDSLYFATYVSSVQIAFVSTLICLLIGYPMAYYMARASESNRNTLMLLVMLPFWTSFLIRVYARVGILENDGLLNHFLLWLGVISEPLRLYHTNWGTYIGMVYSYLPFMIMPLYAHLVKMDMTLIEAAYDPGAKPWKAFLTVTLPLSKNGIIAGSLLVFIPAVGEYVIPELLGGADTLMIGRVMWNEFFNNIDWPMASAVTCAMVLLLLVPMALFQHYQVKDMESKR
ncbi:ABC transporter permease subunit [Paludibacterium sp. dN 18-1]|uniref:ABC transporter permease subunit n=2 Tax=Paludibacterium denitrificans TaxID=2675226 RepID=A0A844GER9_9NEIS|nr:ABC transporter permease subunit [Paludibacterium denitrificans]